MGVKGEMFDQKFLNGYIMDSKGNKISFGNIKNVSFEQENDYLYDSYGCCTHNPEARTGTLTVEIGPDELGSL